MIPTNPPSWLSGFLRMKCPKCRTGDLFVVKSPYNLNRIAEMPERCPCCNQSFFPETGFYFGAMYASYMLSVAFSVAVAVAYWVIIGFSMWGIIITDIVLLIVCFPYLYRYSRAFWLSVTVYFSSDAWQQALQKLGTQR
jgi:hypothetical protein